MSAPEWTANAVEAAPDPIVTVDAAGTIVDLNEAAEALLGPDAVGKPGGALIATPAPLTEPGGPRRARVRGAVDVELTVARTGERPERWTAFLRESPPLAALLASAEELARMGSWEVDMDTRRVRWTEGMFRILGLAPGPRPDGELLLSRVHPEDRERIAAVLEHMFETEEGGELSDSFRVVLDDGSVRELRFRGRQEVDERTGRCRWIGATQDVTAERLAERELQAHYAVSQALRDWESFEEGSIALLRRIATALEYPLASLWLPENGVLRCAAFWHEPSLDSSPFETALRSLTFAPGEGNIGKAWKLREPVLTPDVGGDPQFTLHRLALQLGLQSAVTFPADAPDGPLAVLSLYALERRVLSPSLMRTLTGIGRDLGRFLARRRAQLGPRPLTKRELEVLTLAVEGLSGPQIAERLFVSPSTIKTHLEHIYDKLGVGDRAAAVATAIRTGLIA